MAKQPNKVVRWGQKTKVRLKILAPVGVKLNSNETAILAQMYQEDAETLYTNEQEITKAIAATQSIDIAESIEQAVKARSQAVGTYKQTKDPVKKREWARRVVVADHATKSMRDMKKRMSATKDRLTMIKGDIELQLMEAEARAQEAEAYAKAGKGLRLAGQKLVNARTRANKLELEYDNLEVTMEGAEMAINNKSADQLVKEANAIITGQVA